MRTNMPAGGARTGTPVRRGHGVRWPRRRRLGRRVLSLTSGAMRLVRQPLAGVRHVGAVAFGREGLGLRSGRGGSQPWALGSGEGQ